MIFSADRRDYARQIKVAAIGGGACRALDRMLLRWPRPPCTVAVDTDDRSLDASRAAAHLPLGGRLTKGFGSGGDPRVGKLAAEESVAEWRSICADTDWMILLAALGGGTGTGAASTLARVAMSCGTRVTALATLPFDFEGNERMQRAQRGVRELHAACDAVIATSNSGLVTAAGVSEPATAAFAAADGAVGFMLTALCRMIQGQGLLTMDMPSLQRLLGGRAQPAAFGFGRAEGSGRAATALADLLACPLLADDHRLSHANGAWVGILAGDTVSFLEIETTLVELRAAMKPEATLLTGVYADESFGDEFNLAAVTTGARRKAEEPGLSQLDVSVPLSSAARRPSATEEQLKFDPPKKGRFNDVDPTIVGGEDLDIPTFIRRKIRFEAAR